jgi:ATP-dependent RNA helicase DOB1
VPQALEHQIKMVKKEVKTARGLVLQDDLRARQKVLKRLGYVDEAGMVSIKVNHCGGIAEELPQSEKFGPGSFWLLFCREELLRS